MIFLSGIYNFIIKYITECHRGMMKAKSIALAFVSVFVFALLSISVYAVPDSAYSEKPVIVLDAGHGGMDGGTTAGIRYEKTYNLLLAQYVRDALNAHGGFTVVMTRDSDSTDMELLPRALYAYNNNADLLLSLHCNSSSDPNARGVIAYTSRIDEYSAYTLGSNIVASIANASGLKNTGCTTRADTGDELGVYYWSSEKKWDMPGADYLGTVSDYYSMNTWGSKFGTMSLIVEHCYLSNEGDRNYLDVDSNIRTVANAEAQAIINYYYGHTHSFTDYMITDFPSNCTLGGSRSYHCTICGMKVCSERLAVDPNAHFYRQESSSTTSCTEDGYTKFICQIAYNLNDKGYACDVHSYSDITPAKGHEYTVISETPASHGVDGEKTEKCSVCGDTLTTITEGEKHTHEQKSHSEPSCTEDGVTVFSCSICSDTYEERVEMLGHDYQVSEEISPDCTTDGSRTYICSRCNDSYTESIPCEGHKYEISESIPATCTEDGFGTYLCTVCSDSKTDTIPATGHSYEISEQKENTCYDEGFITYTCLSCGDTYTDTLSTRNHEFDDNGICQLCGYENPDYCNHDYIAVSASAPTCTEEGVNEYECSKCGDTYSETVEPIGHDLTVDIDTEPTCIEDGVYIAVCNTCGETASEIRPCSGHDYSVINEDDDFTYLLCSVCGTSTKIDNKVEMTFVEFITQPIVIIILALILIQILVIVFTILRKRYIRKHLPSEVLAEEERAEIMAQTAIAEAEAEPEISVDDVKDKDSDIETPESDAFSALDINSIPVSYAPESETEEEPSAPMEFKDFSMTDINGLDLSHVKSFENTAGITITNTDNTENITSDSEKVINDTQASVSDTETESLNSDSTQDSDNNSEATIETSESTEKKDYTDYDINNIKKSDIDLSDTSDFTV